MKTDLTIQILKQLIDIPSFVDSETNEQKIGQWIYDYLCRNTDFSVVKQKVTAKTFNIIATKGKPYLWLAGHMDTVPVKGKELLTAKISDGKIYGRGAVDMKGGIASILAAVNNNQDCNNLGLLFYCDEEYNFAGMKTFLENYKFEVKPLLTIIAEPSNLYISNAHRGIVEFEATIKGKSGHASRPKEGLNAISLTVEALNKTAQEIKQKYSDPGLGESTCNTARIKGGMELGKKNNQIVYSNSTNVIADTAEIAVDVRTAAKSLNGEKLVQIFSKYVKQSGCKIESIKVNIDLGSLNTDKKLLGKFEGVVKKTVGFVKYIPAKKMGYGDGQMISQKTDTPVVYFGCGPTETCHTENEYANIESVIKTTEVFINLLKLK